MIYSKHLQFVDSNTLQAIHQELLTGTKWVFRKNFWRYYLIDGLLPYKEEDESTWYGTQQSVLTKSLHSHWLELFNKILTLAGPSFVLQRYALTGQTAGQEQTMHPDTSANCIGDYRSYLVYLNTEWDPKWGGCTEFVLNQSTMHYENPEPGKLIVFNSQTLHRGQSPVILNKLRLSLVLHGRHI